MDCLLTDEKVPLQLSIKFYPELSEGHPLQNGYASIGTVNNNYANSSITKTLQLSSSIFSK